MGQLQKFVHQLQQDLDNVTREAALIDHRDKEHVNKCRMLEKELKVERDAKKKMRLDMQHMKKQFHHESKRKEKEIDSLKGKMHKVLSEKTQGKKLGIDILNFLPKVGVGKSFRIEEQKQEDEMNKYVVIDHEDKQEELTGENTALRKCLSDIYCLVREATNSEVEDVKDKQKSDNLDELLQRPFLSAKVEIENKFKSLIDVWKEKLQSASVSIVYISTSMQQPQGRPRIR